ncbi:unnamed protein product [Tuber melanosporum]|uniref:(Perigord truffle) hypothetical protein n=1 Tax=Tuber melanosporum (strain Mel28) TaxID=656061 RepID=D5GPF5_TUBMM|nr:uncharacterized protein GSTUM_00011820001 [Tuber melanosporum]CAZ86398.1 unnamed protein product [Tuber melanosporum]
MLRDLEERAQSLRYLRKEAYEQDMETKTDFKTMKAGQRLIGWHVSAFVVAGTAEFGRLLSTFLTNGKCIFQRMLSNYRQKN